MLAAALVPLSQALVRAQVTMTSFWSTILVAIKFYRSSPVVTGVDSSRGVRNITVTQGSYIGCF